LYERSLINEVLLGPLEDPAHIVLADGDGAIHKLTLDRIPPRGNMAQLGYTPPMRVWIETRRVGGTIGYVRFNAFLDPEHLMPEFEKAVRDCLKCDGFVIDVRRNPGGIAPLSPRMPR